MFGNKKSKSKIAENVDIEDYLFSVSEEESSRIEQPFEKGKLDVFWTVIFVCLAVLVGRIFYLNVFKGNYYSEISKGNSIRSVSIKAPRGKIVDRFGNVLVNNVPSVDAVFIPAYIPKNSNELDKLASNLSNIFSISYEELSAKLSSFEKNLTNPVLLKENISQEEYLSLEEKKDELPGITILSTAIRDYSDSTIFSHILGYVGKVDKKDLSENDDYLMTDYIGKQGIEKSYEKFLRGKNGILKIEVDSKGNPKKERGVIPPEAGSDLVLGIDYELQRKIYDTLSAALEKTESKTAAAVAIDPRNGEVRALVSLPSFDNNLFSGKISQDDYLKLLNDPHKPLFNRAISGEYPPGSTIKPIIALAALSEGTITSSTIIDGLGGILSIGSFHFRDWKVHGPSDVKMAIAQSNDIFFYTIGGGYGSIQGLGMDKMKKYENLFGLGDKLGIDIPGESSGLIPDRQWKIDNLGEKWYTGDDYHCAIGQGFITETPLQVANSIAAIANGGTLYQPRIVSKIIGNDGKEISNSSVVIRKNFIDQNILKIVQEGMRETVLSGTAQTLKELPVQVAGKTGTAQFGSGNQTHAWFTSYAPYENPELAMVVLVEGGGEGNSSALPVTKEVYRWYFGEGNKDRN